MTRPRIKIVVAYSDNRVIGRGNTLPWRIPSDLAHFKRNTMGLPIIMGRKTWESLGRALPGRPNLVVSRQAGYTAPGASVFPSLEQALESCPSQTSVCIIGGAQIFEQALALADEIIATEVHAQIDGDVFFPRLAESDWRQTARDKQPDENGYHFDFVTYTRRQVISEGNHEH